MKFNFSCIHDFDLNHANRNHPPKEQKEYQKKYFLRIRELCFLMLKGF